jgi:hypothetical protein
MRNIAIAKHALIKMSRRIGLDGVPVDLTDRSIVDQPL